MTVIYVAVGGMLALLGIIYFYQRERFQRAVLQERLDHALHEQETLALRLSAKEEAFVALQLELAKAITQAEELRKGVEEKLKLVENSKQQLADSFKALSMESLEKNAQTFLTLANTTLEKFQERAEGSFEKKSVAIQELFTPVKETLSKLGEGMQQLEKERKGDHVSLQEQLKSMVMAEKELKQETATLVRALRAPTTRGRWGEMQLRRIVELCGMINHCDFFEQCQEVVEEKVLRPDMVIKLPGHKQVIVDAKTPFEAYFEAMQTADAELKETKLKQHAKHVRAHIMTLGKKAYWEMFDSTPEFVVLFLPSESFFSAALEQDPSLMEIGVDQRVVLATPMTLIGLLRAIAYGWKQEKLSRHAQDIFALGKELHKRICDMQGHITKLGKSLSHSVESYNKMMGSLETRVLVTARKFHSLGIGEEEDFAPGSSLQEHPKPSTAIEFIP